MSSLKAYTHIHGGDAGRGKVNKVPGPRRHGKAIVSNDHFTTEAVKETVAAIS